MSELKKPWYWLGLPVILMVYAFAKGSGQIPTELVLRLILLAFGYTAALMDLKENRVPNKLVAALAIAWLLVLTPLLLLKPEDAITIGIRGIFGFLIAGAVLLTVYLVSRKGLGGGDVKLMSVSGLYLGYDGVLTSLLCGSILAAAVSICLILAKKMTVKDTVPLIPFLYAGMLFTEFAR